MTLLVIATVSGARGVRGELKLRPVDTPPEWLATVKRVQFSLPNRQAWFTVQRWQWKPPFVLAVLEGIADREAAAAWAKAEVEADEADLPALPEDTYRAKDLEGKPVFSVASQQQVATVDALMFNADSPFLKLRSGEQTWLVPFQAVFFPAIDADKIWLALDLNTLS